MGKGNGEDALQKHVDLIVRRVERKYLNKLYYLTILGPLLAIMTFVIARTWLKEDITDSTVVSLLIGLITDRIVDFFSRAATEKSPSSTALAIAIAAPAWRTGASSDPT